MPENDEEKAEIRRLQRLLQQISEIAQESSLTGGLTGGAPSAAKRYNSALGRLEELSVVSEGLFLPLPEGVSFDEIGVESKLLAGYLSTDVEPERREERQAPHFHGPVVIGGLEGLEELKEIGQMIRDHLPDFLKASRKESAGSEEPPAPPSPPELHALPEPMPDMSRHG